MNAWMKWRGKRKIVVFKVNFEKVYDLVSWDYLEYMMGRL